MKYNAKKTIALILSVVFVLMLFAGCGSSSEDAGKSTASAATDKAVEDLLAAVAEVNYQFNK